MRVPTIKLLFSASSPQTVQLFSIACSGNYNYLSQRLFRKILRDAPQRAIDAVTRKDMYDLLTRVAQGPHNGGETIMEPWIWYIIGGIAAGLVSSMFGVGAGILLVPLFVIGYGFGQKTAQGMALAVMIPMALTGAIRYHLHPAVDLKFGMALVVALGGVIGALLGSKIVLGIPNHILKRMFACFVVIAGVNMLIQSFRNKLNDTPPAETALRIDSATTRDSGTP